MGEVKQTAKVLGVSETTVRVIRRNEYKDIAELKVARKKRKKNQKELKKSKRFKARAGRTDGKPKVKQKSGKKEK